MQGAGGLWEKVADFQKHIFSAPLKHRESISHINSEGLHNILVIWGEFGELKGAKYDNLAI